RKLRQYAQSATGELRENLGPGFEDLQPSDLNPKKFIQRQVSQVLENEDSTVQDLKDIKAAIDPDLL
ncbi:MAG: Sec-independent protein secretion pathway component, partial [Actinomycetes bacterium]